MAEQLNERAKAMGISLREVIIHALMLYVESCLEDEDEGEDEDADDEDEEDEDETEEDQ